MLAVLVSGWLCGSWYVRQVDTADTNVMLRSNDSLPRRVQTPGILSQELVYLLMASLLVELAAGGTFVT